MSDRAPASGSGLSIQTLLISAASAVIATVLVSQFWAAGTLFFTALVPVAVAVVSEVLRRPAEKITEVAPLVAPRIAPILRSDRTEERELEEVGGAREAGVSEPGEADRPTPTRAKEDDPFDLYTPDRPSVLSGRAVRLGLITGLLAFVIAAVFVTVSELALLDGSIGDGKRRTTLVGGTSSKQDKANDADATATPDADSEATPTATPGETATPDASATPTASPDAESTPTAEPEGEGTPAPTAAAPASP